MPSDWTRRSVYRTRVIRRRRRLLAVLAVLALVAIGAVAAQGRAGGGRVIYDRTAAAAYADRWALGADPVYWRSAHDDCANFVSQCVAAGGLPRFEGPAGSWRDTAAPFPASAGSTARRSSASGPWALGAARPTS